MTLAAERWPTFAGPVTECPGRGTLVVWRLEVAKLARQTRVRVIAGLCVLAPLLVVVVFRVQQSTPDDTLFGQWIHSSGLAVPLVVLGWAGQWVLPGLVAIVAGDIFSSEDHLGTWKTLLTRSRSRRQLFAGKLLAAITFAVGLVGALTVACYVAGLLMAVHPLVGLNGQLVGAGRAEALVIASWASQLPPVLAFCGLSVLVSVLSRNSVIGIGGPLVLSLALQLVSLVSMPVWLGQVLPTTAFGTWVGFWTEPAFTGPFTVGVIVSAAWFVGGCALAWAIFRRRDMAAS